MSSTGEHFLDKEMTEVLLCIISLYSISSFYMSSSSHLDIKLNKKEVAEDEDKEGGRMAPGFRDGSSAHTVGGKVDTRNNAISSTALTQTYTDSTGRKFARVAESRVTCTIILHIL